MQEGYLVSDKNRRAVFVGVLSGDAKLDRIVRKHRLVPRAADRALAELKEQGLVEEKDGALELTADGRKVAAELRRKSLLE